jgi:hypothetical protein
MRIGARLMMLCAAGLPTHANAEALGRLFFTPEQRQILDRQRLHGDGEASASGVRLDGVVCKPSGRRVVWVNGRSRDETADDAALGLRVGESLDPATGEKIDVVPHGSVTPAR